MNASEKRILKLAIILFIIGLTVRYLPWGLPSIEHFEVGETFIVANEASQAVVWDRVAVDGSQMSKNDANSVSRPQKERKPSKKVNLPVHVNTASLDELCALNGVGPKLAEKILEVRNALGAFKNAEDLQKVPGIGKKKLEKLLPGVIFD